MIQGTSLGACPLGESIFFSALWYCTALMQLNGLKLIPCFQGYQFCSVQSLSRVPLFATPWTVAQQASLSITDSQNSFKLMFIKSMMPAKLSHPLWSPSPTFNLSRIRVFSNESVLHIRWPKYWLFSINSSNEYSGLISFRMDWLDLLSIQGTLT